MTPTLPPQYAAAGGFTAGLTESMKATLMEVIDAQTGRILMLSTERDQAVLELAEAKLRVKGLAGSVLALVDDAEQLQRDLDAARERIKQLETAGRPPPGMQQVHVERRPQ